MILAHAVFSLVAAAASGLANEAVPATDPTQWIRLEDWPPAIDLDRDGDRLVRFKLTVGPIGNVTGCQIIDTSGSSLIDWATCRALKTRARFIPHSDQARYFVGKYRWVLPQ
jgi:protein TonB